MDTMTMINANNILVGKNQEKLLSYALPVLI
jgi:hypothetical protein